MAFETPAVVVGAGVNGLGVARSLARAQVPVWLLNVDVRRPEMHTCAARPLKISALQGEALIDDLVRFGTTRFRELRPVLFLTQEESVKSVSHHRERLSGLYRFSLPPREVVDRLQHKQGFQTLAEKFGAPIPPLVHIRKLADLPALWKVRFPVVIKPGERHAEYGRLFKKAYRVDEPAEAERLIRSILPVTPDVVVQEWIEGPDANIYFCLQYLDKHGQTAAAFTGRKIRSWPPQTGGTASCIAAPDAHAELSQLTTRFFQNAGVIGMAGMEYKRDARSGEFRMVEPTVGRSDYQEEVATLNGVNLPYAAYCVELGIPPDAASGWVKRPVAWRVRAEDHWSAVVQNQPARRGFDGAGRITDAWWRWSDPLPSLLQNLWRIQRALRTRTLKKMPGSQMAKSKS